MRIVLVSLLLLGLALVSGCSRSGPTPPAVPTDKIVPAKGNDHAGSVSCRECHENFYKLWAPSHHGLAMQPFTPELGLKQFTPTEKNIKVGSAQFSAHFTETKGFVREQTADGKTVDYPIVHLLGGKNIYYCLTSLERGRLQTLPLAYNVNEKRWYDMPSSGLRHFAEANDAPLDWRHSAFTFNTSCFSCHVSQLSRNYDERTDTYHTVWREPGINCETCHGPAGEHVEVCRALAPGEKPADIKLISTKKFSVAQMNDACTPCHAKMAPVSTSFRPGERYFDHFDLVTLENADFYPDGRDLGENYTLTTWRLSPCAQGGKLSCLHCHTSSGRSKFTKEQANQACLPCHADKVNDSTAHSFHKADSPGNRCVACHMPTTGFAAMTRSDHSMRSPMPAATVAFKSPNACNLCHTDKDAAWADQQVRKMIKRDYQAPVLHWGKLIAAARKHDWARLPEMLEEVAKPKREEVVAASMLRLLGSCDDPRVTAGARQALKDESPLVRAAAVEALANSLAPETTQALLSACKDDLRVVRVRAAAALSSRQGSLPAGRDLEPFQTALAEYLQSLRARPDHWSAHYNLGNFYMGQNDLRAAIAAFEKAVHLEPQVLLPYVNLSMAYAQVDRRGDAEAALRKALALDPENPAALLNLGLLLGEDGRIAEAKKAFQTVLKRDPRSATAAYNLGVLLAGDNLDEAIRLVRIAFEAAPNGKHGSALAFYLQQKGANAEARRILRQTLALPDLSPPEKQQLEATLKQLEQER